MQFFRRRTARSYVEFIWIYFACFLISSCWFILKDSLLVDGSISHLLRATFKILISPLRMSSSFLALGFFLAVWNVRDLEAPVWRDLCLAASAVQLIVQTLCASRILLASSGASFSTTFRVQVEALLMAYFLVSVIFGFHWDGRLMDADVWMAESTCRISRDFRRWTESNERELWPAVKEMVDDAEPIAEIRKAAEDWRQQDHEFRVWRRSGETIRRGIVKEMLAQGYAINRLREIAKRIEVEDERPENPIHAFY
ncbi:hypothetical protein BJ878DRAFT_539262 [Calycina marina]|uniref:Uncharacterized protein n=1 Tax=Calycina marina TaxID=1763456 RepID=A0A9P7Z8Z3_9HELO|nr:hypothetical protein BJ878DRAFT_539262 [Calycina marina]